MKITEITLYPVAVPLKRSLRWGAFEVKEKSCVVVKVVTDEGVYGVGECGLSTRFFEQVRATVRWLMPHLIGQDPLEIGRLWQKMYSLTHQWGRRGVETYALSGIDIALWDLMGKITGQPIHHLLGTVHNELPAYYAPSLKPSGEIAAEAAEAVEAGFRAIKVRTGLGETEDLAIVREVRRAVGEDVVVMVDPNMAYDLKTAKRLADLFAEYNVYWLEEPVRAQGLHQYVQTLKAMREYASCYIAGGECLFTRFEFTELLSQRAVDIVQPDCTTVGGITEAKKIASMAEAWDVMFIPHIACSSIGAIALAAAVHVLASSPNARYVEYDPYETEVRHRLAAGVPQVERGRIRVPEGPGLGIELDWDVVRACLI